MKTKENEDEENKDLRGTGGRGGGGTVMREEDGNGGKLRGGREAEIEL